MSKILQLLRIASLILADDRIITPEVAKEMFLQYKKEHPGTEFINEYDLAESQGYVIRDIDKTTQVDDVALDTADKVQKELLDKQYFDAIKNNDMDTVQKIVDEAAEKVGYATIAFKGMLTKDWRTDKEITIIRSANGDWAGFFSSDKQVAQEFEKAFATMGEAKTLSTYLNMDGAIEVDARGGKARDFQFDNINPLSRRKDMVDIINQSDVGVIVRNTADEATVYVPKNPSQIKSAEPVVYDDDGNVIPLSQRFNQESDDIRY